MNNRRRKFQARPNMASAQQQQHQKQSDEEKRQEMVAPAVVAQLPQQHQRQSDADKRQEMVSPVGMAVVAPQQPQQRQWDDHDNGTVAAAAAGGGDEPQRQLQQTPATMAAATVEANRRETAAVVQQQPQNNLEEDNMERETQRRAPPKDKLVDRKTFTMSDLVKWKPKTENTLKRKWAERRRQIRGEDDERQTKRELKTELAEHDEEGQPQQVSTPAAANSGDVGGTRGGSTAVAATPPPQQQPSSSAATSAGPRVMINEHGEMVVDEQSLVVVENPEQNADLETVNDDLLPRRITSASFRRKAHRSSVWRVLETDLFYEVLSATGTDFGLMHEFIQTRTRVELKNKFNREERTNPARLNEALKNPTMLDERLRQRVDRMMAQMADQ